jgi:hypothetical protein
VAQIGELVEALNRTTDQRSPTNRSDATIAREAGGSKTPQKVPMQNKNSQTISHLTA